MKLVQQGFTLIELMIVVAIIGILAAIAIPAYQDYTIRAQVTEGATLMDGVKVAMQDYYAQHGSWPTSLTGNDAALGLNFTGPMTGQYVSAVATPGNGEIVATYGLRANAKIRLFQAGTPHELEAVGIRTPRTEPVAELGHDVFVPDFVDERATGRDDCAQSRPPRARARSMAATAGDSIR